MKVGIVMYCCICVANITSFERLLERIHDMYIREKLYGYRTTAEDNSLLYVLIIIQ